MGCILTADIGTTAVKVCLWDEALCLLASSSREYTLLTPTPGFVELDPGDYWTALCEGVRQVMGEAGVTPFDVKALVPTTQGETLIPVDREHRPLHNAIVWLDARATEEAVSVRAGLEDAGFFKHTGIPEVGPAVPLCKELWLRAHAPDVYAKTRRFLLLEDYIIMKLTDALVAEPSLACSSGCYDIHTGQPWEPSLAVLDKGPDIVPKTAPSGTPVENLTAEAADALGLTTSTMVVTGAFDQACSTLGAGNTGPGVVTETTGTALVLAATSPQSDIGTYRPVPVYRAHDTSLLLTPYAASAGIVLKWFRDAFCPDLSDQDDSYARMGEMAAGVPAGSDGLVLLPHFEGAMAPTVVPEATGTFHGASLIHTRAHFIRAIMEGVGCALRDTVGMLRGCEVAVDSLRCLGGGANSPLWCQIKADICGIPMATMAQSETTSLGAAMLGAVAMGWFGDVGEAVEAVVTTDRVYEPTGDGRKVGEEIYGRYEETHGRLWGLECDK